MINLRWQQPFCVQVKAFENRRITYAEEWRFMLLRHWTLYDSMLNSPYIATRLQTYKASSLPTSRPAASPLLLTAFKPACSAVVRCSTESRRPVLASPVS